VVGDGRRTGAALGLGASGSHPVQGRAGAPWALLAVVATVLDLALVFALKAYLGGAWS